MESAEAHHAHGGMALADIVTKAARSRMIGGIRAANTTLERAVRGALYLRGLRFRLHVSGLLGKPDWVFPRYRAVVFVNGCF
jgi:DNA mismatch endonuclease, patch repair protein